MTPPAKRSSLAAAGAQGRGLVAVPPSVLAFTVHDVQQRRPETLLSGRVQVGAAVNPALDALWRRLGASRSGAEYRFDLDHLSDQDLDVLMRSLVPAALVSRGELAAGNAVSLARARRSAASTRVNRELDGVERLRQAVERTGFDATSRKGREKARGSLLALAVRKGSVTITVHAPLLGEALDLPAGARRLGAGHVPVTLRVREALELLERAGREGVLCVDHSEGVDIGQVEDMLTGTVLVTRVEGSPGLCHVDPGEIDGVEERTIPAAEGLAVVARKHLEAGVAVEDTVVEVAEMALCAPVGRAELHPYQDLYCSMHLVSRNGIVNALAPGMGKTVCTLAAWREAAQNRTLWRGIAAVPAGLREQWRSEAESFFPEADVHVISKEEDLEQDHSGSGIHLYIVSHDGVGRYLERLTAQEWDEVVVDEASVVLKGASARTRALWELRRHARKGAALTGTPEERGAVDIATLVHWARQEEVEVAAGDSALEVLQRCGPTVFQLAASEISDELPEVTVRTALLAPGKARQAVEAAAGELSRVLEELADLQAKGSRKEAAQLRVQLPRYLGALRRAASRGPKQDLALELAREGAQVLAFTDFPESARELLAAADEIPAGMILGGQGTLERTAAAAAFLQGELRLLCVSGTGHRGLNLQAATDVVHLDLPLSAAALVQRTARAVRLGGTREALQVHVPALEGTPDERLAEAFEDVLEDLADLTQESSTKVDLYTPAGMRWLLES